MNPFEFAFQRQFGPDRNYPKVLGYVPPKKEFYVLAGPCSVESELQIMSVAEQVKNNGGTHLRGGVFRAGTYPGKNFGLIDEQLVCFYHVAAKMHGLKNIIEVLDYRPEHLEKIAQYADCFQVGCRQMQNYQLLRIVGSFGKPVFLKRHPGTTIDEFMGSAEHLLVAGAKEVVLIERGSVGNARHVRWDLSISMIPAVKAMTKMPILVDSSHGTGRRDLVMPLALAGVAAGADGLLVEVHPDPKNSLSDAEQAIDFQTFGLLMSKVSKVRSAIL